MTILNNLPQGLASPLDQLVAIATRFGLAHHEAQQLVLDFQNAKTPEGQQLLTEIANRGIQQLNG